MTCYSPLIRYETNEKYRCLDGHLAFKASIVKLEPGSQYEDKEKLQSYVQGIVGNKTRIHNCQIIPCGKCIGCRLEYSRQWAIKAVHEASLYKNNWFLTITYDNEHLPPADNMIDPKTGEDKGKNPNGSLKAEDLTNFIKRLRIDFERKRNHKGIRYMCCGEYGDRGQRPHYHGIFFNLPLTADDLIFHEYNGNYEPMYRVPILEKIWGKGLIVAADVNFNTCAYVARYVTKKVGIPTQEEYYKCLGVEPEFFRMSRKPGIGRQYYEEHKEEIYKKDEIVVKKYDGGLLKLKPPKYYDSLYDLENHTKLDEIKKERRKKSENINRIKYNQTTNYKKNQLKNEEQTKEMKNKALRRDKF